MKSVHQALHLRHHKHTGKLLAHKHTSYRVLFLLMLAPIIMMNLVGQLATATDYEVTAIVPVTIPEGIPVVTSPTDNSTTDRAQIVISGTCPVSSPPIVIAIYDGGTFVGSGECTSEGTFSVTIWPSIGTHTYVATVVTITGQMGASSAAVTITRLPSSPSTNTPNTAIETIPSIDAFVAPLRIVSTDAYLAIKASGEVTWKGHFDGGVAPYAVQIDWGDGVTDSRIVIDQTDQSFTHTYTTKKTYKITVKVTDDSKTETSLQTIAGTLSVPSGITTMESNLSTAGFVPIITFLQQHIWQVYIVTLSGLSFLWYLERGRHYIPWLLGLTSGKNRGLHKHR